MRPGNLILLVTTVIFSLWGAIASGGVPTTINHQGYLTNAAGVPVNSTVGITFSLYSSNPARNNPVWRETQPDVTVSRGIYSAQLGSAVPISAPFDVQYFLGIKVGSDPEMTPLQALTSVPYALRSKMAETVSGNSINTAAIADNSITADKIAPGAVTDAKISGPISDTKLSTNISRLDTAETVTGGKTFAAPIVSTVGTGDAPLQVASTTVVPNLNAEMVGGKKLADLDSRYQDKIAGPLSVAVGGTGQSTLGANKLLVGNGTDGILTPSDLHWDNTNNRLGLGTTAPNEQLEMTGNIRLPATTATAGIIRSGNFTLLHTYGGNNLFTGLSAGNLTTTGSYNTATGNYSLSANTTGYNNTASGYYSLKANTTGRHNTASGYFSLNANTIGDFNTATGYNSLSANTTANLNTAVGTRALQSQSFSNGGIAWDSFNTAVGSSALFSNQPTTTTNGFANTALGSSSLYSNTIGYLNTASGYYSHWNNTTGYKNTATGANSLYNNTTGNENTANGYNSLNANTTAARNTAIGAYALNSNDTGNDNTAVGYLAGSSQTSGNNNIYLGANVSGTAAESNVIRIGHSSAATTYITGIYGKTSTSGLAVYVNSNGLLGTTTSSRRFKEEISDMGAATDGLMQLRPVTFRYKPEYADGSRQLQYGLIAEEVAEVFPEVVAYDDKGAPYTVYYQFINAMLLNEVQTQHKKIQALEERLSRLEALLNAR